MHVGLLLVMVGIMTQQLFHEGGTFALAEGEKRSLESPGALLERTLGPCAPEKPPAIEVGLSGYDFSLRQKGYSPDRGSRLVIAKAGGEVREVFVDRAAGVTVAGTTIYQAIPTGLALVLDIPGLGSRAVNLQGHGREATAGVTDPAGRTISFHLKAEREITARLGTGKLDIEMEHDGRRNILEIGQPFSFGEGTARVVAVTRWSAFTYSRSPGLPAVFVGFFVVLGGCALMLFPAGVARMDADSGCCRVHLARGAEALLVEWRMNEGMNRTGETP